MALVLLVLAAGAAAFDYACSGALRVVDPAVVFTLDGATVAKLPAGRYDAPASLSSTAYFSDLPPSAVSHVDVPAGLAVSFFVDGLPGAVVTGPASAPTPGDYTSLSVAPQTGYVTEFWFDGDNTYSAGVLQRSSRHTCASLIASYPVVAEIAPDANVDEDWCLEGPTPNFCAFDSELEGVLPLNRGFKLRAGNGLCLSGDSSGDGLVQRAADRAFGTDCAVANTWEFVATGESGVYNLVSFDAGVSVLNGSGAKRLCIDQSGTEPSVRNTFSFYRCDGGGDQNLVWEEHGALLKAASDDVYLTLTDANRLSFTATPGDLARWEYLEPTTLDPCESFPHPLVPEACMDVRIDQLNRDQPILFKLASDPTLCLDVAGIVPHANGEALQLFVCTGNPEHFVLHHVSARSFQIRTIDNFCVQDNGSDSLLTITGCSLSPAQEFSMVHTAAGAVFQSRISGLYLAGDPPFPAAASPDTALAAYLPFSCSGDDMGGLMAGTTCVLVSSRDNADFSISDLVVDIPEFGFACATGFQTDHGAQECAPLPTIAHGDTAEEVLVSETSTPLCSTDMLGTTSDHYFCTSPPACPRFGTSMVYYAKTAESTCNLEAVYSLAIHNFESKATPIRQESAQCTFADFGPLFASSACVHLGVAASASTYADVLGPTCASVGLAAASSPPSETVCPPPADEACDARLVGRGSDLYLCEAPDSCASTVLVQARPGSCDPVATVQVTWTDDPPFPAGPASLPGILAGLDCTIIDSRSSRTIAQVVGFAFPGERCRSVRHTADGDFDAQPILTAHGCDHAVPDADWWQCAPDLFAALPARSNNTSAGPYAVFQVEFADGTAPGQDPQPVDIGLRRGGKRHADTFPVWGRTDCPDPATLLYPGRAISSTGLTGAADVICVADTGATAGAPLSGDTSLVSPVEFAAPWTDTRIPTLGGAAYSEVPCAVCTIRNHRTWVLHGAQVCPADHLTLDQGYLMGGRFSVDLNPSRCIHSNPERVGDAASNSFSGLTTLSSFLFRQDTYAPGHELTCAVCASPYGDMGRVAPIFGANTCPDDLRSVFEWGFAGRGFYFHNGGLTDTLCLTPNPTHGEATPRLGAIRTTIHSVEYEVGSPAAIQDVEAPCAMCQEPERTAFTTGSSVMIPGATSCPAGYSRDYEGLLMANYGNYRPLEVQCVDARLAVTNSSNPTNDNGGLFYAVAYSDTFGDGTDGLWAPCVRCSKAESGSVYTRFGRDDCPADSALLYAGAAVGSDPAISGGMMDTLCMASTVDPSSDALVRDALFGTRLLKSEYQFAIGTASPDDDIPCAVCETTPAVGEVTPSDTFVAAGRSDCPATTRLEYSGLLASNTDSGSARGSVCIDAAAVPGSFSNPADEGGPPLHQLELDGATVDCAVCSALGSVSACSAADFADTIVDLSNCVLVQAAEEPITRICTMFDDFGLPLEHIGETRAHGAGSLDECFPRASPDIPGGVSCTADNGGTVGGLFDHYLCSAPPSCGPVDRTEAMWIRTHPSTCSILFMNNIRAAPSAAVSDFVPLLPGRCQGDDFGGILQDSACEFVGQKTSLAPSAVTVDEFLGCHNQGLSFPGIPDSCPPLSADQDGTCAENDVGGNFEHYLCTAPAGCASDPNHAIWVRSDPKQCRALYTNNVFFADAAPTIRAPCTLDDLGLADAGCERIGVFRNASLSANDIIPVAIPGGSCNSVGPACGPLGLPSTGATCSSIFDNHVWYKCPAPTSCQEVGGPLTTIVVATPADSCAPADTVALPIVVDQTNPPCTGADLGGIMAGTSCHRVGIDVGADVSIASVLLKDVFPTDGPGSHTCGAYNAHAPVTSTSECPPQFSHAQSNPHTPCSSLTLTAGGRDHYVCSSPVECPNQGRQHVPLWVQTNTGNCTVTEVRNIEMHGRYDPPLLAVGGQCQGDDFGGILAGRGCRFVGQHASETTTLDAAIGCANAGPMTDHAEACPALATGSDPACSTETVGFGHDFYICDACSDDQPLLVRAQSGTCNVAVVQHVTESPPAPCSATDIEAMINDTAVSCTAVFSVHQGTRSIQSIVEEVFDGEAAATAVLTPGSFGRLSECPTVRSDVFASYDQRTWFLCSPPPACSTDPAVAWFVGSPVASCSEDQSMLVQVAFRDGTAPGRLAADSIDPVEAPDASRDPATTSASQFVRWGVPTCPAASVLVYSGYAAGGPGSGNGMTGRACLPSSPSARDPADVLNIDDRAEMHAAVFATAQSSYGPLHEIDATIVTCAVCEVVGRTAWVQSGSGTCPVPHTTLFSGVAMVGKNDGRTRAMACVDVDNVEAAPATGLVRTEYFSPLMLGNVAPLQGHERGTLLMCAVCATPDDAIGEVITVRGASTCPEETTAVFEHGALSSSWYLDLSGVRDVLCLTPHQETPDWAYGRAGYSGTSQVEFEGVYGDSPILGAGNTWLHNREMSCAVCQLRAEYGFASTLYGTEQCPSGTQRIHGGWLAGSRTVQTDWQCVDLPDPADVGGSIDNEDGGLLFMAITRPEEPTYDTSLPENRFVPCIVCATPRPTWTHYGRRDCPGAHVIHSGSLWGSEFAADFGAGQKGAQFRCLSDTIADINPSIAQQAHSLDTPWLYEVQIQIDATTSLPGDFDASNSMVVSCATCMAPLEPRTDARPVGTLMMPGLDTCPAGWRTEYSGLLFAAKDAHGSTDAYCLNSDFEPRTALVPDLALLYPVEARDTAPTNYAVGREVWCAQCTRLADPYCGDGRDSSLPLCLASCDGAPCPIDLGSSAALFVPLRGSHVCAGQPGPCDATVGAATVDFSVCAELGASRFQGPHHHVTLLAAPGALDLSASAMTVSAWVRPTTPVGYDKTIVDFWDAQGGLVLGMTGDGLLQCSVFGADGAVAALLNGPPATPDTWIHVACAAAPGGQELIVDGLLVASASAAAFAGPDVVATPVVIGRSRAGTAACRGDVIVDVAVFAEALTPATIAAQLVRMDDAACVEPPVSCPTESLGFLAATTSGTLIGGASTTEEDGCMFVDYSMADGLDQALFLPATPEMLMDESFTLAFWIRPQSAHDSIVFVVPGFYSISLVSGGTAVNFFLAVSLSTITADLRAASLDSWSHVVARIDADGVASLTVNGRRAVSHQHQTGYYAPPGDAALSIPASFEGALWDIRYWGGAVPDFAPVLVPTPRLWARLASLGGEVERADADLGLAGVAFEAVRGGIRFAPTDLPVGAAGSLSSLAAVDVIGGLGAADFEALALDVFAADSVVTDDGSVAPFAAACPAVHHVVAALPAVVSGVADPAASPTVAVGSRRCHSGAHQQLYLINAHRSGVLEVTSLSGDAVSVQVVDADAGCAMLACGLGAPDAPGIRAAVVGGQALIVAVGARGSGSAAAFSIRIEFSDALHAYGTPLDIQGAVLNAGESVEFDDVAVASAGADLGLSPECLAAGAPQTAWLVSAPGAAGGVAEFRLAGSHNVQVAVVELPSQATAACRAAAGDFDVALAGGLYAVVFAANPQVPATATLSGALTVSGRTGGSALLPIGPGEFGRGAGCAAVGGDEALHWFQVPVETRPLHGKVSTLVVRVATEASAEVAIVLDSSDGHRCARARSMTIVDAPRGAEFRVAIRGPVGAAYTVAVDVIAPAKFALACGGLESSSLGDLSFEDRYGQDLESALGASVLTTEVLSRDSVANVDKVDGLDWTNIDGSETYAVFEWTAPATGAYSVKTEVQLAPSHVRLVRASSCSLVGEGTGGTRFVGTTDEILVTDSVLAGETLQAIVSVAGTDPSDMAFARFGVFAQGDTVGACSAGPAVSQIPNLELQLGSHLLSRTVGDRDSIVAFDLAGGCGLSGTEPQSTVRFSAPAGSRVYTIDIEGDFDGVAAVYGDSDCSLQAACVAFSGAGTLTVPVSPAAPMGFYVVVAKTSAAPAVGSFAVSIHAQGGVREGECTPGTASHDAVLASEVGPGLVSGRVNGSLASVYSTLGASSSAGQLGCGAAGGGAGQYLVHWIAPATGWATFTVTTDGPAATVNVLRPTTCTLAGCHSGSVAAVTLPVTRQDEYVLVIQAAAGGAEFDFSLDVGLETGAEMQYQTRSSLAYGMDLGGAIGFPLLVGTAYLTDPQLGWTGTRCHTTQYVMAHHWQAPADGYVNFILEAEAGSDPVLAYIRPSTGYITSACVSSTTRELPASVSAGEDFSLVVFERAEGEFEYTVGVEYQRVSAGGAAHNVREWDVGIHTAPSFSFFDDRSDAVVVGSAVGTRAVDDLFVRGTAAEIEGVCTGGPETLAHSADGAGSLPAAPLAPAVIVPVLFWDHAVSGSDDFEPTSSPLGLATGLVEPTLTAARRPRGTASSGFATFDEWYFRSDSSTVERFGRSMVFALDDGEQVYRLGAELASDWWPLDGSGFGAETGDEPDHNTAFTMMLDVEVQLHADAFVRLSCIGDCWMFVDGRLVVDMGGLHAMLTRTAEIGRLATARRVDVDDGSSVSEGFRRGRYAPGDWVSVSVFYAQRLASLGSGLQLETNARLRAREAGALEFVFHDLNAYGADSRHPDVELEGVDGQITGLVASALGFDLVPKYTPPAEGDPTSITSKLSFESWYRSRPGVNIPLRGTVEYEDERGSREWVRNINPKRAFAPLGALGFGHQPPPYGSNFGFTSIVDAYFWYEGPGSEILLRGDDDLWVFLDNQLVLDFGGLHEDSAFCQVISFGNNPSTLGLESCDLEVGEFPTLGIAFLDSPLEVGTAHSLRIFHAERRTSGSSLNIVVEDMELLPLRRHAVPVTYRDFQAADPGRHPDFGIPSAERWVGPTQGHVEERLDVDGKPVLTDLLTDPEDPSRTAFTGQANFRQWYRNPGGWEEYIYITQEPGTDVFSIDTTLTDDASDWFPITELSGTTDNISPNPSGFNKGFTAELHIHVMIPRDRANDTFFIEGGADDDYWLFVDGQLALDAGGNSAIERHYGVIAADRRSIAVTADTAQYSHSFAGDLGVERPFVLSVFMCERGIGDSDIVVRTNLEILDAETVQVPRAAERSGTDIVFDAAMTGVFEFEFSAAEPYDGAVVSVSAPEAQSGVPPLTVCPGLAARLWLELVAGDTAVFVASAVGGPTSMAKIDMAVKAVSLGEPVASFVNLAPGGNTGPALVPGNTTVVTAMLESGAVGQRVEVEVWGYDGFASETVLSFDHPLVARYAQSAVSTIGTTLGGVGDVAGVVFAVTGNSTEVAFDDPLWLDEVAFAPVEQDVGASRHAFVQGGTRYKVTMEFAAPVSRADAAMAVMTLAGESTAVFWLSDAATMSMASSVYASRPLNFGDDAVAQVEFFPAGSGVVLRGMRVQAVAWNEELLYTFSGTGPVFVSSVYNAEFASVPMSVTQLTVVSLQGLATRAVAVSASGEASALIPSYVSPITEIRNLQALEMPGLTVTAPIVGELSLPAVAGEPGRNALVATVVTVAVALSEGDASGEGALFVRMHLVDGTTTGDAVVEASLGTPGMVSGSAEFATSFDMADVVAINAIFAGPGTVAVTQLVVDGVSFVPSFGHECLAFGGEQDAIEQGRPFVREAEYGFRVRLEAQYATEQAFVLVLQGGPSEAEVVADETFVPITAGVPSACVQADGGAVVWFFATSLAMYPLRTVVATVQAQEIAVERLEIDDPFQYHHIFVDGTAPGWLDLFEDTPVVLQDQVGPQPMAIRVSNSTYAQDCPLNVTVGVFDATPNSDIVVIAGERRLLPYEDCESVVAEVVTANNPACDGVVTEAIRPISYVVVPTDNNGAWVSTSSFVPCPIYYEVIDIATCAKAPVVAVM